MKSTLPLFLLIGLLLDCTTSCAQPGDQPDAPRPDATTETINTAAGESFTTERTIEVDSRYEPLIRRLVADGFPERFVRERFADKRTVFIPKLVRVDLKKKSSGKAPANSSAYRWV